MLKEYTIIEFDVTQLIFDHVIGHAEKVHTRDLLHFSSLNFQVLTLQNPNIVKIIERCERTVLELNFSLNWMEGKYVTAETTKQAIEEGASQTDQATAIAGEAKVPNASSN